MKKLLATLLASTMALTAMSGLVACGGEEKKPAGETNIELPEVTLALEVWAPDGAIPVYTEIFEDFKKEYPAAKNYTVSFEAKGEGEASSAVRTDPETGPNIYFLASDQIDKNAEAGALQPLLPDLVNNIKARDGKGSVDAAHLDANPAKDLEEGYYAFPNANSNGYFLIYDTQFFSASDVASLDTMVEKASGAGKKIIFDYGNGFYNPTFFFGMDVGLGDTSSDYKVTLDTAAGYEAGKTFVKYFGTGATGVWTSPTGNNAVAEGFKAGDVVAGVMGTWVNENNALYNMADSTDGWSRDRIGFAKLPTFTDTTGKSYQMGSFMGAKYCGVNPAKEENQVIASLAFADFINRKENQIKRFLATGDAPTNNEAAEDSRVTSDKMLAALAAQNKAGGRMQLVTPTNFWTALQTFGNNVYAGTTKAENIEEEINKLAASMRSTEKEEA